MSVPKNEIGSETQRDKYHNISRIRVSSSTTFRIPGEPMIHTDETRDQGPVVGFTPPMRVLSGGMMEGLVTRT